MKIGLITVFFLTFHFNTFAATKASVTMPETISIKGNDLYLNGLGVRKATWLNIKVYVGGLYVEKKSKDFNVIINSPGIKYIRMYFLRDLKKEKLTDAWTEAFNNRKTKNPALNKGLAKLNSLMGNIKRKQEIEFTFIDSSKVHINFANSKSDTINLEGFPKALLSVWFINPLDEGLKNGLLGLK